MLKHGLVSVDGVALVVHLQAHERNTDGGSVALGSRRNPPRQCLPVHRDSTSATEPDLGMPGVQAPDRVTGKGILECCPDVWWEAGSRDTLPAHARQKLR